ncbi:MAG: helix-turn-helix domain-containing protein [Proteobacteria bacterium]|nr:helix-turn-helix domain-containing protein [Pseudomonadota bacterium]
MTKRWLRLSEACKYAGLSPNTFRKYVDLGIFRADRTEGGHRRIDRESIDEYFDRSRREALAICSNF